MKYKNQESFNANSKIFSFPSKKTGKAYDVTYIRLVFQSPRPETFVIYKREVENGPWNPFQYYSSDCRGNFNVSRANEVPYGEVDATLCSQDFSDISPLSGGNVVFSTLQGRPSQYDLNPRLQVIKASRKGG